MQRVVLGVLGVVAVLAVVVVPGLARAYSPAADRAVFGAEAGPAGGEVTATVRSAEAGAASAFQPAAAVGMLSLGLVSVVVAGRRRSPQPAA